MEWGHRVLGCTIGVAFVLPLAYFPACRLLTRTLRALLLDMAVLLGTLGWYMVCSRLEEPVANGGSVDNMVLRESQDRLAVHLMFAGALSVIADWRFTHNSPWGQQRDGQTWEDVLCDPVVCRFKTQAAVVTGLVFLTTFVILSAPSSVCVCMDLNCHTDTFVVGIGTGLVCNKFPLMGGRLQCPG